MVYGSTQHGASTSEKRWKYVDSNGTENHRSQKNKDTKHDKARDDLANRCKTETYKKSKQTDSSGNQC